MGLASTILSAALLLFCYLQQPCDATVDLSNVDLQNFRYFKYPQTAPAARGSPPLEIPARFQQHTTANGAAAPLIVVRTIIRPRVEEPQQMSAGPLQKVRAFFAYFGRVLFGNLPIAADVPVHFDPEAAYRLRENYQRENGFRGERLVAQLGNGGVLRKNPME